MMPSLLADHCNKEVGITYPSSIDLEIKLQFSLIWLALAANRLSYLDFP
jgi:hypothetical protein